MAIRRAVLVIADIGGYTAYMNWNRTHLVHAQMAVAALPESVIDAAKGMKPAKSAVQPPADAMGFRGLGRDAPELSKG